MNHVESREDLLSNQCLYKPEPLKKKMSCSHLFNCYVIFQDLDDALHDMTSTPENSIPIVDISNEQL